MSRKKILAAMETRLDRLNKQLEIFTRNSQSDLWSITYERQEELQSIYDYIIECIPDHAKDTIKVWRFADAPEAYRTVASKHVEADSIAFIPDALYDTYLGITILRTVNGLVAIEYRVDGGFIRIGERL